MGRKQRGILTRLVALALSIEERVGEQGGTRTAHFGLLRDHRNKGVEMMLTLLHFLGQENS